MDAFINTKLNQMFWCIYHMYFLFQFFPLLSHVPTFVSARHRVDVHSPQSIWIIFFKFFIETQDFHKSRLVGGVGISETTWLNPLTCFSAMTSSHSRSRKFFFDHSTELELSIIEWRIQNSHSIHQPSSLILNARQSKLAISNQTCWCPCFKLQVN